MTDRPTKKQRELLSFIDGFIKGNGYGPSYREIMRALDYKSVSTVAVHIDSLIAKGQLIKHGRSARSLEVVGAQEIAKPSASDEKSHQRWLIEQVDTLIDRHELEPNDRSQKNIEIMIEGLMILGMSQAARDARKRLAKEIDSQGSK